MVKYIKENHEDIIEIPIEYIKDATLLSAKEYEEYRNNIPKVNNWWWLRNTNYINVFREIKNVSYTNQTEFYIRPVLILNAKSSDFNTGDKFEFGGHIFTIISDNLAICNDFIGKGYFREDYKAPDANVYEKSDVKKIVDNWFDEAKYNTKDEFEKDDWGF